MLELGDATIVPNWAIWSSPSMEIPSCSTTFVLLQWELTEKQYKIFMLIRPLIKNMSISFLFFIYRRLSIKSVEAVRLWNNLFLSIKSVPTLPIFKFEL